MVISRSLSSFVSIHYSVSHGSIPFGNKSVSAIYSIWSPFLPNAKQNAK